MASWRASASELAQSHLDALFAAAMAQAEMLVRKHGEFYPFAVVRRAGASEPETILITDDGSGSDRPDADALLRRTVAVLREQRGELDALAIAFDAYMDGQPVIRIELEHREGPHLGVHQPYRPRRIGRGARLGRVYGGVETEPRIWATD